MSGHELEQKKTAVKVVKVYGYDCEPVDVRVIIVVCVIEAVISQRVWTVLPAGLGFFQYLARSFLFH